MPGTDQFELMFGVTSAADTTYESWPLAGCTGRSSVRATRSASAAAGKTQPPPPITRSPTGQSAGGAVLAGCESFGDVIPGTLWMPVTAPAGAAPASCRPTSAPVVIASEAASAATRPADRRSLSAFIQKPPKVGNEPAPNGHRRGQATSEQ